MLKYCYELRIGQRVSVTFCSRSREWSLSIIECLPCAVVAIIVVVGEVGGMVPREVGGDMNTGKQTRNNYRTAYQIVSNKSRTMVHMILL